jgi:hypothetical protein
MKKRLSADNNVEKLSANNNANKLLFTCMFACRCYTRVTKILAQKQSMHAFDNPEFVCELSTTQVLCCVVCCWALPPPSLPRWGCRARSPPFGSTWYPICFGRLYMLKTAHSAWHFQHADSSWRAERDTHTCAYINLETLCM